MTGNLILERVVGVLVSFFFYEEIFGHTSSIFLTNIMVIYCDVEWLRCSDLS